jgi:Dual-action HEIGH metallo-peptidase
MKNFQRTLSMFVFALLLTGVFTLGGCEKTELNENSATFAQQLLSAKSVDEIAKISEIKDLQIIKEVEFLKKQKYVTDEQYVKFHKTGMPFEGLDDIPFYDVDGKAEHVPNFSLTRDYIQRMMKQESARHRRYTNMFLGGTISVKVHQNVPIEWNTAVAEAVAAWNGLGVNLTFSAYTATDNTLESNKLDITWASLSLVASTQPNSANKYSEKITISSTNATVASTTPSGRKVIMVHELGHAIGLMHTDVVDTVTLDVASTTGCGSTSGVDSQSIMRQYPGKTSPWTNFTGCDWNVINHYW